MNRAEILKSFQELEQQASEGISFGVARGFIPITTETAAHRRGWLRIVNADPEAYLKDSDVLASGLGAATIALSVQTAEPVVYSSARNLRYHRDFVNGVRFTGSTPFGRFSEESAFQVAGIYINSIHVAGMLRVIGGEQAEQFCSDTFN